MAEQTSNGGVTNGGRPPTAPKPSSLGHLLKRFSPAHRLRSKSPAPVFRSNDENSATPNSMDNNKKSSWVTVEFTTETLNGPKYASPATNGVVNGLAPRTPAGKLQKSSTLPVNPHNSPSSDSGIGSLSAFFARASFRKHQAAKPPTGGPPTKKQPDPAQTVSAPPKGSSRIAAAASEENLISKSLVVEKCCSVDLDQPLIQEQTNKKTIPYFYSQDNVFDSSIGSRPARVPSYVRLSCTLSGYKNYRSIDLSSPNNKRVPKLSLCSQTIEIGPTNSPVGNKTTGIGPVATSTPLGKSIVERRLEVFTKEPSPAPLRSSSVVDTEQVSGAVAVRDIINSFNRRTPPAVPPRLKSEDSDVINNSEQVPSDLSRLAEDFEKLRLNDSSSVDRKIDTAKPARNNRNAANLVLLPAVAANRTSTTTTVVEQVNGHDDSSAYKTAQLDDYDDDSHRHSHKTSSSNDVLVRSANNFYCTTSSGDSCTNIRNATNTKMNNGHSHTQTGSKDGRFYDQMARRERQRLRAMADAAERDLLSNGLPEHAAEEIRVAVGKLNLLLKKKFAMFESLIAKNLNPIPDDPCPAYDSDLDGYWQLVSMELADIDEGFSRIERMKKSNWNKIEEVDKPPSVVNNAVSRPKSGSKKPDKAANTDRDQVRRNNLQQAKIAALERQKCASSSVGFIEI